MKKKRQEAQDQLKQYVSDKKLQQRAHGYGWTLHQFIVVFRGWHCEVCEEI